jgi:glycolate oxidase FAD binding subunit
MTAWSGSRRVATAADAVAGVVPSAVFEPRTREECVACFEEARRRRLSLAIVGGGTKLGLGTAPRRLDAIVSTTRLDRVVEHSPSDQVVVAEAGITLARLQATLAVSGQRLACDAPQADRATLGGLLATNDFGPLRTRFGSLRDLVLGVSVLRADAAVVRGGGKVVKNVAGYDVPKLMVGALGTLGMIETVTLRLHPLAELVRTVRMDGLSQEGLRALVVLLRREQLEPCAVAALGVGDAFDALVRFEGFGVAVDDACRELQLAAAELGRPVAPLSHEAAAAAWADHDAARTAGQVRLKIAAPPSALARVAQEILRPLAAALHAGRIVAYPTLGLAFVTGGAPESADPGAFAAAVADARARLSTSPGSLVIHDLPLALRGPGTDVWGAPPPALPVMRRLKERFDPEGRLNAGRFVGGL